MSWNLFLAYDGSGNIMALLKEGSAQPVEPDAVYEYGAFGERQDIWGAYAKENPFRFSTKYTDTETGLIYFGFRYYAPSLGRFLTRDPIAEHGGPNLYLMAGNDPVNSLDILGLMDPDNPGTGTGGGRIPIEGDPPVDEFDGSVAPAMRLVRFFHSQNPSSVVDPSILAKKLGLPQGGDPIRRLSDVEKDAVRWVIRQARERGHAELAARIESLVRQNRILADHSLSGTSVRGKVLLGVGNAEVPNNIYLNPDTISKSEIFGFVVTEEVIHIEQSIDPLRLTQIEQGLGTGDGFFTWAFAGFPVAEGSTAAEALADFINKFGRLEYEAKQKAAKVFNVPAYETTPIELLDP